ncbi:MAG: PQQ-binding-like beta-propeller repeat protein [Lentisphaeria bacterium]|nr:PQQ-binding-like beta-propeller repeat protein [Lentisphaeria bacterium]
MKRHQYLFFAFMLFSFSAAAGDWVAWRGPNADGISDETGWNPEALANGAQVVWSADINYGYAAVAVKDGHVFAIGNDGSQDTVRCLNAATGKEIWAFSYPCASGGGYKGPRASPILNGPAVFTVSQDAQVHCLRADNGALIWKKNLATEFGAQAPKWKHAATPRVLGELLIFNAGKTGLALKKQTGKKVWGGHPGISGYASPLPFKNGNQTAVAIFAEKELLAVDTMSGNILWRFPWETKHDVNAADPLIVGKDKMFISSGYGRGGAMIDFAGGQPRKLWENKAMSNHFSSSVFMNGFIFGIDGNAGRGKLTCLDPKDGSVAWEHNTGFGSLLGADGKLIILNDSGKLMIADATGAGYNEHSSAQTPLTKTCWTMPILSNGHLFCRNDKGKLVCIDLR